MRDSEDDLDRLFAVTPAQPPGDIGGRARRRLRAIQGARRLTLIALVDGAALLTLAVLAYLLGAAIADGEIPALLGLAIEDRALAIEARRELALAFASGIPWPHVLAVAVNALSLYAITAYLIRATDDLHPAAELSP